MTDVRTTTEELTLVRPFRVSHATVRTVTKVSMTMCRGSVCGQGEVTVGPWTDTVANEVASAALLIADRLPGASYALGDVERAISPARATLPAAALLAEMTALDLLARAEQAPLWALLQLPEPPSLLALWATVPIGEPIDSASPRIKVKLGGPNDAALLDQLRAACGEVLVDVNRGWSVTDFDLLADRLRAVPLTALEDPVSDVASLQHVRQQLTDVPVILDEGIETLSDVAGAVTAADGVNVKLLRMGGLLEARKALEVVAGSGAVAMIGCYIESPRAIAYAAQLAGLATICDLDGHLWLTGGMCAEGLSLDTASPGIAELVDTIPSATGGVS